MSIRLTFTGDLLVYSSLIKKSRIKGAYDFNKIFEAVKPIFEDSDYVVGNLETPLGYSGFTYMDMLFKAPAEFGDALKNAGFNMITTANNHCTDAGIDGLKDTIHILDDKGLEHTGTFANRSDKRYLLKSLNGVKIAFVSFTYDTNPNVNGVQLDGSNEYMVNLTKKPANAYRRNFFKQLLLECFYRLPRSIQDRIHPLYPNHIYHDNVPESEINKPENNRYFKQLTETITEAKNESDIVVACLHVGGQFNSAVGAYTRHIIDTVKDAGADITICNHPHCVLPSVYEKGHYFEAQSLGNFTFTPKEGYFIDGVYGEYGIVVSIDIDSVKKLLTGIQFHVVRNVKTEVGEQVVPTYKIPVLFPTLMTTSQLEYENSEVINRFLGTKDIRYPLKDIYTM